MDESRRSFLKKTGVGIAAVTILPRKVFGKMGGPNDFIAPSDQLTKGIIGTGGIGRSSYHFTSDSSCRLVALCDVDQQHLQGAVDQAAQRGFGTVAAAHAVLHILRQADAAAFLECVIQLAPAPHHFRFRFRRPDRDRRREEERQAQRQRKKPCRKPFRCRFHKILLLPRG